MGPSPFDKLSDLAGAEDIDIGEAKLRLQRESYLRHFMLDYLENTLRTVVQQNALKCARQLNYFSVDRVLEQRLKDAKLAEVSADQRVKAKDIVLRDLDEEFDNCLGKHSDSYEHALVLMTDHMRRNKKSNVTTHTTPLDSRTERQGYVMGGETLAEPVYEKPRN